MRMPEPDREVLARRREIIEALRAIVPGEGVIVEQDEMRVYETDALTAYKQLPMVVVLPKTTEQVSKVLKYCNEMGVKVVPRGAGTSLSGGALPLVDGIILGLGKFNKILDVDYANRTVTAQYRPPAGRCPGDAGRLLGSGGAPGPAAVTADARAGG